MSGPLQILVNQNIVEVDEGQEIVVRERDPVCFRVKVPTGTDTPLLFVEDFSIGLIQTYTGGGVDLYESKEGPHFREVFGTAVVRLNLGEVEVTQVFNVLLNKLASKQIESMIAYLFSVSDTLIRVCLARSTLPVGSTSMGNVDPETLLSTAEEFVKTIVNHRLELAHHLRKRLVPIKSPSWKAQLSVDGIDPYDVITNLDSLIPVAGDGDVIVKGRHYSLHGMDVTTLYSSADVEENSILIGGMYSIRAKVQELLELIDSGNISTHLDSHDKEHESLSALLARVTTGSMKIRCEAIIEAATEIIRYFEVKLGFVHKGEILPRITPFVRSSRTYFSLFHKLHEWYQLGVPSLNGLHFLSKLRTVSKIYEFFVLFKMLEFFTDRDWEIVEATQSIDSSALVPSMVTFEQKGVRISLFYDNAIPPYNKSSLHLDLVDLKNPSSRPEYWFRPDFMLKVQFGDDVRYLILDAKYSTKHLVATERLPDLLMKYFVDMGVVDLEKQRITSDRIYSVIAVFPGSEFIKGTFPRWNNWGNSVFGSMPRLPMAGGVTLSTAEDTNFQNLLTRIIEVSVLSMHSESLLQ